MDLFTDAKLSDFFISFKQKIKPIAPYIVRISLICEASVNPLQRHYDMGPLTCQF